jgi:hypothetical protein
MLRHRTQDMIGRMASGYDQTTGRNTIEAANQQGDRQCVHIFLAPAGHPNSQSRRRNPEGNHLATSGASAAKSSCSFCQTSSNQLCDPL